MKRDTLIVLGLLLLTAAAFWGVRSCGFVDFDDDVYVINNPHIDGHLSMAHVKWAFTTFYQGNYLPLTWLSLILDARLFGLGPRGFHLTNAVLHAINVVLLYLWFRRATGSPWRSALVASIWAVHPLRVESVVWIVERKDVLTVFWGLLAMHAYLQYTRALRWRWYLATAALFTAALLSKQTLATLPFLLLLLDYWPLGRWAAGPAPAAGSPPRRTALRLILEKLPLLLLVAAMAVVTLKAQSTTGSVASLADIPLKVRLQNTPVSYARYLGRMFWFPSLAVYYPLHAWSALPVAAACVLLVGLSAVVAWKFHSRPWLGVGWLWFLGVLVPMIGLVQFAGQAMADRFTYFSGIGILVIFAWLIPESLGRRWPTLTAAAAGALLGILSIFTLVQTSYWKNSETLFGHDIAVAGSSLISEIDMAAAVATRGDLNAALDHLHAAVKAEPGNELPNYDLAVLLATLNRPKEAIPYLVRAVEIKPNYAKAHNLLAHVLNLGGRYTPAEHEARRGIESDSTLVDGYKELGIALSAQGRTEEARTQFKLAISVNPRTRDARQYLRILDYVAQRDKR